MFMTRALFYDPAKTYDDNYDNRSVGSGRGGFTR